MVRCKVDPAMIVQKRLPWQVRKHQLRQQLWKEEDEDLQGDEQTKTPGIVVEIAQAARKRKRDPHLWTNLLDQALSSHAELTPQDMASVLSSMAQARFQHNALLDEFVRSLSYRSNVKAMVTAMLAVDKLGLPTDALRAPFLQQLSGQCDELSFGDLRRILMALARCWQAASVDAEVMDELCNAIVDKSRDCDPRDLVTVPQHLGRLRHLHVPLLSASANAVATLVASRLTVLPLDALRAMDGLLLLTPLLAAAPEAQVKLGELARKCGLLAAALLRHCSPEELWRAGAQLAGAEVAERQVWEVWAHEVLGRRDSESGRTHSAVSIRKRILRQWGLLEPPTGLDFALRVYLRPA